MQNYSFFFELCPEEELVFDQFFFNFSPIIELILGDHVDFCYFAYVRRFARFVRLVNLKS